jgi:hypothetical protein
METPTSSPYPMNGEVLSQLLNIFSRMTTRDPEVLGRRSLDLINKPGILSLIKQDNGAG